MIADRSLLEAALAHRAAALMKQREEEHASFMRHLQEITLALRAAALARKIEVQRALLPAPPGPVLDFLRREGGAWQHPRGEQVWHDARALAQTMLLGASSLICLLFLLTW